MSIDVNYHVPLFIDCKQFQILFNYKVFLQINLHKKTISLSPVVFFSQINQYKWMCQSLGGCQVWRWPGRESWAWGALSTSPAACITSWWGTPACVSTPAACWTERCRHVTVSAPYVVSLGGGWVNTQRSVAQQSLLMAGV